MTSEEMTTGSVRGTEQERKEYAERTRWWNSTGGGSSKRTTSASSWKGVGAIKSGDGGKKFREEWPELDKENWEWMEKERIDPVTGLRIPDPDAACAPPGVAALRRGSASGGVAGAVRGAGVAGERGQGWVRRNKLLLAGAALFIYVLVARLLGESTSS